MIFTLFLFPLQTPPQVILCYLMVAFDENSIPRIQEGAYKFKENLLFFLEAVADFGVPK
jgi:hypothetical protein